MDDIRICPECHRARLEQHHQFSQFLKCPICAFTKEKDKKPAPFGIYPPTDKPPKLV